MNKKLALIKAMVVVILLASFFFIQNPSTPIVSAASSSCSYLLSTPDGSLDATQLAQKLTCLQQQQSSSKSQLQQSQQQDQTLQSEITSLDSSITSINNQIANTTEQVNATQAIIDDLTNSIAQTQTQLDSLNSQLKLAYQQLYEMSQTSLVDTIFQGTSLNTLLSQSQYIESLQTSLQANIDKSNQLKSSLTSQKSDNEQQQANLQSLSSQLQQNKSSLAFQQGQKDSLLQQTQGQEAAYQTIIANLGSQIGLVEADYSERLSASGGNGEGISPYGTGGYQWATDTDGAVNNSDGSVAYYSAADYWQFYIRQCTSFGAWKLNNFTGGRESIYGGGQGNAYNWPNLARQQGFTTSSVAKSNVIISWYGNLPSYMPYGHIAWVDSVNSNGTLNIEEYNWAYPLAYDKRTNVNPSRYGSFTYIYP